MAALYRSFIRYADTKIPAKFLPAWNHPAGPKTIFFWAPWMKWALVGAGIGDINRPAEKLSLNQSSVLAITGCIWSRYSFVIIPVNINLFLVNMFVACTGFYQLSKIYIYEQKKKKIAAK